MRTQSERELARHMLAHHRHGYSLAYVLRKSAIRYAIQLVILIFLAVWFQKTNSLPYKGLCLWGIGMYGGAILRDFGWLRRIKQQWPFTQKIINWQKVEDLAEENASANNPLQATPQ